MKELINILKEKFPELMSRVHVTILHDSIDISCAPEDEVAIIEAVNAIQGRRDV